jgi:hypothetical protein
VVDPVAEDPLDVLDEDLDELVDGVDPPNRLVAARSALDKLFWPPLPPEVPTEPPALALDDEDDDADELLPPERDGMAAVVLELLLLLPEKSRPRPDWLPWSWGAISDAKFSAPVTPVSRSVLSTVPVVIVAVRMGAPAAGLALDGAASRCRYRTAAMDKTSIAPASHHFHLDGRSGTRCGTSCGFRSGGDTAGAGDALFALAWGCMLRRNLPPCRAGHTSTLRYGGTKEVTTPQSAKLAGRRLSFGHQEIWWTVPLIEPESPL